jgi:protein-S-isoprenylcysteine O-methyltransferase Ste14
MCSWPVYAYCVLVLLSRLAFRHRECIRGSLPEAGGASSPGRIQGTLFCLLPLGLMQLAPLIEYAIRLRGCPAGEQGTLAALLDLIDPASAAAGIVAFGAGTWLAAAAARGLAAAWRARPGELYTGGLYRRLRHPMYAGYLLQGLGCALMLSGRWSWLPLAAAAGLILARCRMEDRELAGRFPEFGDYRRATKRLLPGIF